MDNAIQITIKTPESQCGIVDSVDDQTVAVGDLTSLFYRACIGLGYTAGSVKASFTAFVDEQEVK